MRRHCKTLPEGTVIEILDPIYFKSSNWPSIYAWAKTLMIDNNNKTLSPAVSDCLSQSLLVRIQKFHLASPQAISLELGLYNSQYCPERLQYFHSFLESKIQVVMDTLMIIEQGYLRGCFWNLSLFEGFCINFYIISRCSLLPV